MSQLKQNRLLYSGPVQKSTPALNNVKTGSLCFNLTKQGNLWSSKLSKHLRKNAFPRDAIINQDKFVTHRDTVTITTDNKQWFNQKQQ